MDPALPQVLTPPATVAARRNAFELGTCKIHHTGCVNLSPSERFGLQLAKYCASGADLCIKRLPALVEFNFGCFILGLQVPDFNFASLT